MNSILLFMYIYVFVFGCCIASFINVVIYRLPLNISVAKGRSFCPNCHHQLHAIDLFPLFSWIFLRGKCRYCGNKISIRYPLIETLGGILGIICFYRYGFNIMTIISFTLSQIFIAISFIDLDTYEIPDILNILVLVVSIISIFFTNYSIISRVIGFFIISIPMLILNSFIESFGGGDIKLISACGLMLGWSNTLLAMFIAVMIAGSYAIYLLITKQIELKGHIAFGPYICIGVFIALLYGNNIVNWYMNLFM